MTGRSYDYSANSMRLWTGATSGCCRQWDQELRSAILQATEETAKSSAYRQNLLALVSLSQVPWCPARSPPLLFPILDKKAMSRKLSKLILNASLLAVITYTVPVWGYLAAIHKSKMQSVLAKWLWLAAKVSRRFPSRLFEKRTWCTLHRRHRAATCT